MSLGHGATIHTNELAFMYDMSNDKKSWKGRPTENIIATSGLDTTIERSGVNYPFVSRNITTRVQSLWSPTNNKISIQFEGYRDYIAGGNGGGNDGYPVMYVYFSDWSWSTTLGSLDYEWNHAIGNNRTMPDPTGKTVLFAIYHMNAGNRGRSYARNFQIEFDTLASPHVNGTRSNTEAIVDLIKNNSITVSSLTYDVDGSFSFNGISDVMQVNVNSILTHPFTVNTWIKPASSQHGKYLTPYTNGIDNCLFWNNGTVGLQYVRIADVDSRTISKSGLSANTWINVVASIDGPNAKFWVNGELIGSRTETFTIGTWIGNWIIGQRGNNTTYFDGQIGLISAYNTVLTDNQVKQNYEAHRGRYGL